MHFLALGDSYTIGEGVAVTGCWPMQLTMRLRDAGIAIGDPQIVATTGWTTDELAAAMDQASFDPPYDLVTLLIGVNNQYRGRDLANYRIEFTALLERALALAGGQTHRVIVISIPDWGVTRFAVEKGGDPAHIAATIDAYNAVNREVAEEYGVAWVDVTTASRDAGRSQNMLVADALHPSSTQYAQWTDVIFPFAKLALSH